MQSTVSYSNFINDNIKLIPEVGNVILYDELSEILFGRKINTISRLELLNKKFVLNMNSRDGEILFDLSKFEEYILFVRDRVNWDEEKLCPINYFNCLDKLNGTNISELVTIDFLKIQNVLSQFKNYLINKEDKHAEILLKLFWDYRFNGVITNYDKKANDYFFLMSLKFNRKNGLPLILNLCDEKQINNSNSTLSLDEENNFDNLYENWVNILLMDSQQDYVISCLEIITGSIDLAEMIFSSHSNKIEYLIDVNDLNQVISFKNEKSKEEYITYFKMIYESLSDKYIECFTEKDNKVFLNFEGFNKYLLNLEMSYLKNFESKETINTLYYKVMDELVNSYKKLYTFYRGTLMIKNENQLECKE